MLSNKIILIKLLIGFRTGMTGVLFNIFKLSCLYIKVLTSFNLQIELNSKYLYPFLRFSKKHSLFLFNILVDIVCYEFLGDKFRFLLNYKLLSITYSLRIIVKIKIQELNTYLLSITSLFSTAA